MQREKRRLAAIVAADVAGYSRLIGQDEEGTLRSLRAHRKKLIDPLIEEYGGRIANTAGDSLLLEFPSAVDAVRCTVAVQEGMAARNHDIEADRQIRFRVGIHVGDVVAEDDDLLGDGVNVAARLEGLSDSGGAILSDDAYRQVRDRLDIVWQDDGEHEVKNIARAVRVWRWSPAGDAQRASVQGGAALLLPDKPSIAVMPFDNMSDDANQEYFVDGLTEDIITNLSRIRALFVIARNSSFVYKGHAISIEKAAKELGVQYVLEGSARKVGQRIRVNAQLVDAETARHLWAEKYDRDLTDIFEVQDQITRAVVASTQTQLVLREGERRREHADTDLIDLRDSVKLGWRYIYDLKQDSHEKALALSRKALEMDARHPGGHQLRAAALFHRALQGYSDDRREELRAAREAATKAIELDDQDEYSHWLLGLATFHELIDVQATTNELRRALDLNPNFSLAYATLGTVYGFAGDVAKAIENCEMALRLNPRDPSNFFRYSAMAVAHFTARNFEDCLSLSEQSLRSGSGWRHAHIMKIASLVGLRDITGAERAVRSYLAYHPDETVATSSDLPFVEAAHGEALASYLREAGLPD